MRIQQLEALTGASPKAIRHYEALGLLGAVPRRGAYRDFGVEHLELVALVRRAQRYGFTLAALQGARRRDGGGVDWAAVLALVQQRQRALADERKRLARQARELRAIERELASCPAASPQPQAAACLSGR